MPYPPTDYGILDGLDENGNPAATVTDTKLNKGETGIATAQALAESATAAAAANTTALAANVTLALSADVGPITLQTTLQNVTGLALPIGASATEMWLVQCWVLFNAANATMDAKLGFSVPTDCTMLWGSIAGTAVGTWSSFLSSGAAPGVLRTQLETIAYGTAAAGTPGATGIAAAAIVYGGGTAGNVQLQYAQNVSDAGALKILRGSTLEARKLAA